MVDANRSALPNAEPTTLTDGTIPDTAAFSAVPDTSILQSGVVPDGTPNSLPANHTLSSGELHDAVNGLGAFQQFDPSLHGPDSHVAGDRHHLEVHAAQRPGLDGFEVITQSPSPPIGTDTFGAARAEVEAALGALGADFGREFGTGAWFEDIALTGPETLERTGLDTAAQGLEPGGPAL